MYYRLISSPATRLKIPGLFSATGLACSYILRSHAGCIKTAERGYKRNLQKQDNLIAKTRIISHQKQIPRDSDKAALWRFFCKWSFVFCPGDCRRISGSNNPCGLYATLSCRSQVRGRRAELSGMVFLTLFICATSIILYAIIYLIEQRCRRATSPGVCGKLHRPGYLTNPSEDQFCCCYVQFGYQNWTQHGFILTSPQSRGQTCPPLDPPSQKAGRREKQN